MANSIRFELLGDASSLQSAFSEATGSAEAMEGALGGLEESVETLIQGQVELNEVAGRWTNESGDFISSAEAQERALQDLNSVGVESTQQVREKIKRLESLGAIYADDAKAASELSEKQQRLRTELAEVGQAVAQQNRDLSRLDQEFSEATVAMTDFSKRQERLQQELRETAAAQDRVSSSGVTMRSSVQASASNLSFELVQASQDATHSLGAVANQIPLISEQFSQLTSKTGSTTGALFALRSSLLGPAGIIGAITLGLPLVQQLTSSLFEAGEGADTFEDSVSSAADSVLRLREASEDPIRLGLEQARRQADLLSTRLEELRDLRSDIQEFDPGQTLRPTAGGALQPSGIALPQEGAAATTPAQAEDLKRLREQVDLSEKARQRLNDIIAERELQNELLERERQQIASSSELMRGQVRQIQKGTASTEALVSASEEGVVRFERLSGLADDLLGRYQSVNQLLQGQNRLVDENLVTQEQVTDELASRLEDAENIEQVQQRLNSAVEDGLITREQMQSVMEDIRSDTEDTAEAQDRITSAIEQEIIAREDAKALLKDLGTSNDQVARTVAETLGTVEDLRATLEDLSGPQGQILARQQQTKQELKQQVELQKQLNRLQQEALPEGFQTDSPGANLFRQQQSEQFARNLQASARAIDQMAARQQTLNNLVPDPSRIEAANLSLREMLQTMQQVVSEFGVGAVNVDKFLKKVSQVGDRLRKFDIADTRLQAVRSQIRAVKQALTILRKKGVDPASEEVQKLKDKLESLQQAAVGLQVAQQAGLQLATSGFTQLGRAIAGADDAMEKFKQTAASTLQTVGQALLQSAIAGPLGLGFGALGGVFTVAGGAVSGALSRAEGGEVRGKGGPTDDQIPAMLSDKEFVMRAASAQEAPELLQAMNDDPAVAKALEKTLTQMSPAALSGGRQATPTEQAAALPPVKRVPEEFARGGFVRGGGSGIDDVASPRVMQETVMQRASRDAATPVPASGPTPSSRKRKTTVKHVYEIETEMKRINRRELGLLVRGANDIRDQYEYNA